VSASETPASAPNDFDPDSRSTNQSSLLSESQVSTAADLIGKLRGGLGQAILGQDELLDQVVICLLARGHMLLEGLPGLGKTELVKSLSSLLGEDSGDGQRKLVFHKGPIFANLVLADEINRASPKTQAALLEAMQERRATVMGESHDLPKPFFVLATQNPIELEGTYPLPEAQLDRFTFKINVYGVSSETLQEIITTRRTGASPELSTALDANQLQQLFDLSDQVHLPTAVSNYIARLVTATHPDRESSPEQIRKFVKFGASPRAAIALAATSRAAALLNRKPNVGFEDVKRVANSVLSHRIILDYSARLEGWTPPKIVASLLESVREVGREVPEDLSV